MRLTQEKFQLEITKLKVYELKLQLMLYKIHRIQYYESWMDPDHITKSNTVGESKITEIRRVKKKTKNQVQNFSGECQNNIFLTNYQIILKAVLIILQQFKYSYNLEKNLKLYVSLQKLNNCQYLQTYLQIEGQHILVLNKSWKFEILNVLILLYILQITINKNLLIIMLMELIEMKIQTSYLCLYIFFCSTFCSQFNEDLLIKSSYPMEMTTITKASNPSQYEFWSFYITNWQVTSYPWIEQEPDQGKIKQQLLFLMKTVEDKKILAFMYATVITVTNVLHNFYYDGKIIEIPYNPSEYEGIWILNVITLKGLKMEFETYGTSQTQMLYTFALKKSVIGLNFYVGGSGIIFQKYETVIFRGRLSKLFVNNSQRKVSQIYQERINILRKNEYEQTISLIPDIVNFDGVVQKQFEFDQFGRKFSIYGWVKFYTEDAYQLKKYLIVRLTIFKNYQDEIVVGDEILKITADLYLSDKQKCGYDVISHHYWMPYPQNQLSDSKEDKISLRGDLQYLELLSKWHFISFEYGIKGTSQRTQFKLNYFEKNNLMSKTYYLGNKQYNSLFINTKYYAILGGDYTVYEKMKGYLARFYFKSNFQNDLNIQFNCHHSCKTCNGPLLSNCLSCNDQKRVFLDDIHQCVCPYGQYERNQQCYSYSELYPELNYNEIKLTLPSFQCLFGYFYLPSIQQCLKCPQWSPYNLFCADCLFSPSIWYMRPICTIDLITQQINKDQDAYTQKIRSTLDYDVYYINNDHNLILLEGVYDYCDITKVSTEQCLELNVQNLQSNAFGFCKQNRYYSNFSCNLLDNACIKLNKSDKKCLECLSGYYVSDDGTSCLQCPKSCQNCYGLNKCSSCEPNFGLKNEQCVRCGNFCKICKYSNEFDIMQCLSCIDNKLYYQSLNAQDCKKNEKLNCIYAFESSKSDRFIISLDYNFRPYNQPTITQCALCKVGYYYYDQTSSCVQGGLTNCQYVYGRQGGSQLNKICLFGSYNSGTVIYSFTEECPKLKLHCIHCLIEQLTAYIQGENLVIKKVSYKCLVCENGYYALKKTGQCQQCPSELHCLSCYQQNKYYKDNWKNDIRSFYRVYFENYFHEFTDYGISQNDSDYEILCTKCEEGYEFFGDQCIKICPESCLECKIMDGKNVCVKCPLGLRGRNRSLINNQCVYCPQNCELCKERDEKDVHLINPLFINKDYSYYSYYCIYGNTEIFDQELGLYIDCQNGPCQKELLMNFNLICDFDEYQQQINQLQSEQEKITFRHQNILSDDLFSSNSFSQFETQEFYQEANEKTIKKILIKLISQKQQSCIVKDQLQISQNFSSNIFSAIDVELEIYGNGITTLIFQKQLLFVNFKRVHIEGIIIQIEYFPFGPNLLKFTSLFEQTIELVKISYKQDFNLTTFYTIIENAKNVLIQEFLVEDCIRQFSIQAFIKIQQIKSYQTIKIMNFRIQNSSFLNLHLFWFDLKENDQVEITDLTINKTFFNQALIYQTNGQLKINQMHIQSCEIYSQSGLFLINSLKFFELISFDFISNVIYSGKILNINQNLNLVNLYFIRNKLYNNSLLIYNEKVNIGQLFIKNIVFQLNGYSEDSIFIKISSTIIPNKEIVFNQLSILENQLLEIANNPAFNILTVTLIYLEVQLVKIEELIIEKAYGIPDLVIVKADELNLKSISIKQHENHKYKGLYQNFDCFQKSIENKYNYVWIKIYDVPIIEIQQLVISQAQTINYPIIDIKTSILNFQTQKLIRLSEMHFTQNLLLITNKINIASIMKMQFEEDYHIEIQNSIFEKNLMHQYVFIDLINSGLIFFVDCKSCTYFLNNLIFQQNIVTNSSNSIIYIYGKNIEIQNCSFIQNGLFDYSVLRPYLFWGYNKILNIFMEQIKENFLTKIKTGNGKIICQQLIINNITIFNTTGSGLYIYLEKEAFVQIKDAKIYNISPSFQNENENGAAFLIDTQFCVSSVIQLINIIATDIYFRNNGGLLYIQNSYEKTRIQISNLVINDIYSLKGSIFYGEFSFYTKQHQQFIIENLKVQNSKQGYLRFLSTYNEPNIQLLQELKNSRSLFEIKNAQFVSLKDIVIISLFYESLAILTQILTVEFQNCRILNSTIQNSLLNLNLMKANSQIRMVDFFVSNIQITDHITIIEKCATSQLNFEMHQQICSKELSIQDSPQFLLNKQTQENLYNSYCIINQMNQQQQQILSLLDINLQITFLQVSELYLKNINCESCKNGLLNINIVDNFSKIIMNSIIFQDNLCGEQSCLNVIKSVSKSRMLESLIQNIKEKQYDLRLVNYKCLKNFAQKGTCLYIQDVKTLIEDSIFQNNTAKAQGGSMYINGSENFFVLNSAIQYNRAELGGGIFLKDQIIQNLNKQGTLIDENVAQQFGQDFAQLPSQLSVSIDLEHKLSKVKIIEQENILIEEVIIGNYELFKKHFSDVLYVPNGQVFSQYQFFDYKNQEYTKYPFHLRLIPLDQFNNVQENLFNTQCEISGRILTDKEDSIFTQDFTSFDQVMFNQSDYNFDDIIFYFDFDDKLNLTLQLQFHCDSIYIPIYGKNQEILGYHNNYFLRMNIKSLPCQLGEIKSVYDDSCIPCNATQGLYSLTINSLNCSQKDDFSTSEIKSAQLKLKPGFWRPYYDSDYISQCINLLDNCNGGWIEGDTSCYQGHIGALCEECDIHNYRGFGHFSTSAKYTCGSCVDNNQNIAAITAISLWTLISILISVRSNVSLNEKIILKKIISRLVLTKIQYHSNFGILIKMTTNHLQIVSVIFTFKFTSLVDVGNIVNALSNPIQTMTHSLDCLLKDMFEIQIHYSRIIWQLIMPFIYIFLFLGLYGIALQIKKLKYSLNVITTTMIYMYIYLQPFLVGRIISLISFRKISDFYWIQANVAYRYDTTTHYQWLFIFCLPLLIFISLIIPLFFFISLYLNKSTLQQRKIRQKWGYLYNEYKLNAYYWEIIKIIMKQLLIIFLSYYDENIVKKGILLLSLVYIYWEISKKYRPYTSYVLNKLDAYSANVCGISIAVAIGIYIDQQNKSYEIQIPYLIILVTINIQYLIRILKEIVSTFAEENVYIFDKIKEMIINKMPWIQKYKVLNKFLQKRYVQKQRIAMRYLKLKKYLISQAQKNLTIKSQKGGILISNPTHDYSTKLI
ncbi:unnamed protein product [Paramecium primaurelia]|uniref:Uncharacterized protein n=1 Tax=Paramecium primaurelia TaxID=5886 RepID=A0A8S1Q0C3_PARPR|nr:unnamed protein product [Paramecium primaurelia]